VPLILSKSIPQSRLSSVQPAVSGRDDFHVSPHIHPLVLLRSDSLYLNNYIPKYVEPLGKVPYS